MWWLHFFAAVEILARIPRITARAGQNQLALATIREAQDALEWAVVELEYHAR